MTAHQSLGLTLVSPESITDTSDRLWIVQPEWPEAQDSGFIAWVRALGIGMSINNIGSLLSRYKSHCGDADGSLEVEIQIHRSRPNLDYVATASYGDLAAGVLQLVDIKQSVTFDGKSEVDMERLFVGQVSAVWEGPVYDLAGGLVSPPPSVRVDGSKLVTGLEVVGSLRISATIEYYLHILTIMPRPEGDYDPADRDTAYQSTVMAIYSGKVETHDVDLPDMTGNCQGGVAGKANPDDGDGGCVRLVKVAHPCSGQVVEQWTEKIPCPGEEES